MENMQLTEKVAYIKGLMKGMEYEANTNEGKIIEALLSVVADMAEQITTLDEEVGDLFEEVDAISEDLGDVESYLYEDEEEEYDDSADYRDDGLYEITCPACGEVVCVDEDMLCADDLACPNCKTSFEIDFSDAGECGCGDCDCEDKDKE